MICISLCLMFWLDLSYALSLLLEHRQGPLIILFCLVLLLTIFLQLYMEPAIHVFSRSLFSVYSLVTLFICSVALSTVVLVWQCCRCFFSASVQASSILFLLVSSTGYVLPRVFIGHSVQQDCVPDMTYNVFGGTLNLNQSINRLFCPARVCWLSFVGIR